MVMENGSSFEKNMREKLFNYSEEPNPRVWEKIQFEIEKPQSVSEILFPWAGPGLDLIVAILLIFQLNIPTFYTAKPLIAQKNQYHHFQKNRAGMVSTSTAQGPNFSNSKTGQEKLVINLKGLTNKRIEKKALTQSNDAANEIEMPPFNKSLLPPSEAERMENRSLVVDDFSDEQLAYESTVNTALPANGLSLNQPTENDAANEAGGVVERNFQEASMQGGIIRCGLSPNGFQSKNNLAQMNRKGPMLSVVYLDASSLHTLPEDYSSGNPFRAETSKKWLLDLWYAPTLGFSEFSENKKGVKAAYRALRDSSESPAYFGSFGVSLGRKLTDKFFVSVGLQYTNRVEQFEGVYQWDVPVIRVDTIVHNKYIGSTLPRNAIIEYDTIVSTARKSKLLKHRVNFQTWEIPLKAGVRFDKENIVFSLQAGIIATWRTKVSGSLLDPVLMEEIRVQAGIERELLVSGIISPAIEWKLGHRLSLLMEPQYRYFFQSPYSDAFALKLHWQSLALMSGLRVRF
jgi:hypothetical protein